MLRQAAIIKTRNRNFLNLYTFSVSSLELWIKLAPDFYVLRLSCFSRFLTACVVLALIWRIKCVQLHSLKLISSISKPWERSVRKKKWEGQWKWNLYFRKKCLFPSCVTPTRDAEHAIHSDFKHSNNFMVFASIKWTMFLNYQSANLINVPIYYTLLKCFVFWQRALPIINFVRRKVVSCVKRKEDK